MVRRWDKYSKSQSKDDDTWSVASTSVASTAVPSSNASSVGTSDGFEHVECLSSVEASEDGFEHACLSSVGESEAGYEQVACLSSVGTSEAGYEHVEFLSSVATSEAGYEHVECLSSVGESEAGYEDVACLSSVETSEAGHDHVECLSGVVTNGGHDHVVETVETSHVVPIPLPLNPANDYDRRQIQAFLRLCALAGGALWSFTASTYVQEFGLITEEAPWGTHVLNALEARYKNGRYARSYQLAGADAWGVGYFLAPAHFSAINSQDAPTENDYIWYPTLWFRFGLVIYIGCIAIIVIGSRAWIVHYGRVHNIAAVHGEWRMLE